jgi:hypothetical protein
VAKHTQKLEGHLSFLEGRYATLIKDAVSSQRYDPTRFNDLAMFMALQKTRTYKEVEMMELAEEKMMKVWLYGKASEEVLRSVTIRQPGMAAELVKLGLLSSLHLLDLKPFLVVNKSPLEFVISDTPVLETNRFVRKTYPLISTIGLSKAGLQLFIPIGRRHGFLMHDSSAYTLPAPNDPIVLTTVGAVDQLNRLQFLNAYQNLYVPPGIPESYIRQLETMERSDEPLATIERFEMISDGDVRRFGGKAKDEYEPPTEGVTRELMVTSFRTLPSDILMPRQAARPNPYQQSEISGAGPIRDAVWEAMVLEFRDLLEDNKTHFGQFRRFVMTHPFRTDLGKWFERADKRYLFP